MIPLSYAGGQGSTQLVYHLLSHFGCEVSCLVCVVPANVLSQDRLQEQAPNLVNLTLSRVVEAGHKNVAHHEVDQPDAACTSAWKLN